MISSNNPVPKRPQLHRPMRVIPGIWTSCCVIGVIGISFMFLEAQQRRNAQLTTAFNAQVVSLIGETQ